MGGASSFLAVAVHQKCSTPLLYCDAADAEFCPVCDEWSEGPCNDPTCGYCAARAPRPSECTHGPERHWDMNE